MCGECLKSVKNLLFLYVSSNIENQIKLKFWTRFELVFIQNYLLRIFWLAQKWERHFFCDPTFASDIYYVNQQ